MAHPAPPLQWASMPYRLAPSLLSANFARLGDSVRTVLEAGADIIHFDAMDNHYVPNLTAGPLVCAALRKDGITAPIDVHLMVQPVDALITEFAQAGASAISFHPEASLHVHRSLDLIRQQGCLAGLALNPATPVVCLEPVWDMLDYVLVMSVNPGFAGQAFIPHALHTIRLVREAADNRGRTDLRITVDGGIGLHNIESLAKAGADTFVAGTAVFGAPDPAAAVRAFQATCARFPRRQAYCAGDLTP